MKVSDDEFVFDFVLCFILLNMFILFSLLFVHRDLQIRKYAMLLHCSCPFGMVRFTLVALSGYVMTCIVF